MLLFCILYYYSVETTTGMHIQLIFLKIRLHSFRLSNLCRIMCVCGGEMRNKNIKNLTDPKHFFFQPFTGNTFFMPSSNFYQLLDSKNQIATKLLGLAFLLEDVMHARDLWVHLIHTESQSKHRPF